MKNQVESIEEMLAAETTENLLLVAVLGQGQIQSMARQELKSRQCMTESDDFTGAFMTNLSVVC